MARTLHAAGVDADHVAAAPCRNPVPGTALGPTVVFTRRLDARRTVEPAARHRATALVPTPPAVEVTKRFGEVPPATRYRVRASVVPTTSLPRDATGKVPR
ncbi:hypothetical protein ACFYOT_16515 [Saccharothrix saharensis]|uniref:hypothetical protein n=1 Tax=Saccharothrix saharensis TaxID=571190 RepID=UPI0036D193E2